jgi:hypothetical protein
LVNLIERDRSGDVHILGNVQMGHRKIGVEDEKWTELVQDMVILWAIVVTGMRFWVP